MAWKHFIQRMERRYTPEVARDVIEKRKKKCANNQSRMVTYIQTLCKDKEVHLGIKIEDDVCMDMHQRRAAIKAGVFKSNKQKRVAKNKECRNARRASN